MKSHFKTLLSVLILFIFINSSSAQVVDLEEETNVDFFGKITAPDFPEGAEWFNTDKPLSLRDLRGKLVLLDFWTSGCINCIHIIPDLKKLELKYHDELAVIGVHSAKFLNEGSSESIRQAILKNDLEHPVINDKSFEVWDSYNASAWPTLVLIDPKGKIIGMKTGEGVYKVFDPIISAAISEYDRIGGVLNRAPVKLALEKDKISKSLLSYPGKITADPESSRIFVTDSDNNRVLVLKVNEAGDEAVVEEVIGSGKAGWADGSYAEAEFFRPQGVALFKNKLYVADTENHLIREIDLASKLVKTITGTGRQSQQWGIVKGDAKSTSLNSPWDLLVFGNALYIAMAGPHQLWKLDLATGEIGTYAGSGRENLTDGSLENSALAQPSGITTDGSKLYFADPEASAIRSADLNPKGKVKTIIGTGLFEFGDIDGIGSKARIQHALGIFYNNADELLYIADTYNSKLKTVNPKTKEVLTYSGTGSKGNRDGIGDAQFNEPNGLVIMNGKIFVTDTNNNLLRVIDMNTKEVKTVVIKNPEKLMANVLTPKKEKPKNTIKLEKIELKEGETEIKFNFSLPEGFKINPDAKPVLMITSDGNLIDSVETEIETKLPTFGYPVKLSKGMGNLSLEILIYYCETHNIGICKFKDLHFEIPVSVNTKGENFLNINYTLN
jgi:DNA-binding beta-propeller fold protein YncE